MTEIQRQGRVKTKHQATRKEGTGTEAEGEAATQGTELTMHQRLGSLSCGQVLALEWSTFPVLGWCTEAFKGCHPLGQKPLCADSCPRH